MKQRAVRVFVGGLVAGLCLSACSSAPPIPQEEVPKDWTLNVHQPGEWWKQPLIPRSVIVQRCAPQSGWRSDPDLTKVTAVPPGSHVEFSSFLDDVTCNVGWSEAPGHAQVDADKQATEAGLRRICSTSGLPMDAGWRFVGHAPEAHPHYLSAAAFIDDHGTVAACLPGYNLEDLGFSASVELSVGAETAPVSGTPRCPATLNGIAPTGGGAIGEYRIRGAGPVRDDAGRLLAEAATIRLGLAGDTATSSHRVVRGIAIIEAWVTPKAAIPWSEDHPPAMEGQILDKLGKILATCGS